MSTPTTVDPRWPDLQRERRALVVVDVVESVRLMQAYEADVIDRWLRFVNEVRTQVLPAHAGRLVTSLGDGMLLEFDNVPAAVACALQIQHRIGAYNVGLAADRCIDLHVGAHVAEVVVDAFDVFGSGVNLAARLAALGRAGDIVVSADVRDALVVGLDCEIEDLGACYLKGIEAPVRAFRLQGAQIDARPRRSAASDADLRSAIAVVPPTLAEGNAADRPWGEIVASEVIGRLSRSPLLRVVSRFSTAAFRDRKIEPAEIASLLDTDYVLHGQYAKAGREFIVHWQFDSCADGSVLWTRQFRVDPRALLSESSDTLDELLGEVSRSILSRELALARSRPLPTLKDCTLLMAAIGVMHQVASPTQFERAREMLEVLSERGPRHPDPYAWLAKWHILKVVQGWTKDARAEAQRALASVRRALDLDAGHALALTIDGQIHGFLLRDLDTAERRHREAIENNPNEPLAWLYLTNVHCWRGEGRQAVQTAARAVSLSPLDPLRYYFDSIVSFAALSAGEYERAISVGQRSLRSNGSHSSALRGVTIAQVLANKVEDARATVARLLQVEPEFTVTQYEARYPGRDTLHGAQYAQALRTAGVPG